MNKDRKESISSAFASVNFLLPDGLNCNWQFDAQNSSEAVLLDKGCEQAKQTIKLGQESRMSASQLLIPQVGDTLSKEFPMLSVNHSKTNFFEYVPNISEDLLVPNWSDLSDEYSLLRNNICDKTEREVVANFMKVSFGFIDDTQIDIALRNLQNNIFIIRKEQLYVGMFVLVYIPSLSEVQLHSVAGRGDHLLIDTNKPKLPILISGVKEIVQSEFSGNTLTFSSSGASQLYKNLGFKESSRGGISMKRKTIQ